MMKQPAHTRTLHLKGLNGLRAIAALLVLVSHIPSGIAWLRPHTTALADNGVTIFFTLSGFLITWLLLEEQLQGRISIRNFYIRRILRIWPLYYTYLVIAVIVIYAFALADLPGPLPWYLLFAANLPSIINMVLPLISHYWTLGVEEQFYLVWPWLVKHSTRLLWMLILILAFICLLKVSAYFIYMETGNEKPLHIIGILRFNCMAIGAIAAVLWKKDLMLLRSIVMHPLSQLIFWAGLLLILIDRFELVTLFNDDMVALVTCGLIINLAFNERSIISLENNFFNLVGRISYGLYIIHPLVIFFCLRAIDHYAPEQPLRLILLYASAIGLSTALAWISYRFLELPFLKRRWRYSSIKTNA